jgi:hypothetical protein
LCIFMSNLFSNLTYLLEISVYFLSKRAIFQYLGSLTTKTVEHIIYDAQMQQHAHRICQKLHKREHLKWSTYCIRHRRITTDSFGVMRNNLFHYWQQAVSQEGILLTLESGLVLSIMLYSSGTPFGGGDGYLIHNQVEKSHEFIRHIKGHL